MYKCLEYIRFPGFQLIVYFAKPEGYIWRKLENKRIQISVILYQPGGELSNALCINTTLNVVTLVSHSQETGGKKSVHCGVIIHTQ